MRIDAPPLVLSLWPLGISTTGILLCGIAGSRVGSSHPWVGSRVGKCEDSPENRLLRAKGPRVAAGSLARCLPCQICHSLSPAVEFGVGWTGRLAGQGGQVPGWTKPAANKSLVMANQSHWQPLPRRPRDFLQLFPLALSAWRSFRALAESHHQGQSPSLGCGHQGLGAWRLPPCGPSAQLLLPPDSLLHASSRRPSALSLAALPSRRFCSSIHGGRRWTLGL